MKQILSLYLLLLLVADARACDVCGGSSAGNSIGLLPQFTGHIAGVQYQFRNFSSSHPPLLEGAAIQQSEDYYHSMQLWGRVQIKERLQIYGFLPYRNNIQKIGATTSTESGIGDASVLANYIVLNKGVDKPAQHMLLAGIGIKASTGRHNIAKKAITGLPETQPGTGSWDFTLNANYILQLNKIGINAELNYAITTADKADYKYGNRLSIANHVFYKLEKNDLSLMPKAGCRFDYALHDYDNYSKKWLNTQTGGYMLYASVGLQMFYNRVGIQVSYQYPLAQQYADGYVSGKHQADASIFLLF